MKTRSESTIARRLWQASRTALQPLALTLALFVGLAAPAARAGVTVSNVSAAQRPGTKLVDISYDVFSTLMDVTTVSMSVSNGTSAVACPSISGDVGVGVATGADKTIVWDMGADWNGNMATLSVMVIADDGVVLTELPSGGDPNAASWEVISDRWVKNIYANGDLTMSDRVNNKMWLYKANPCELNFGFGMGRMNWYQATTYCANLSYAGYSDWVLPDKDSLAGQYSQQGLFLDVGGSWYWSGSNYEIDIFHLAWAVYMGDGWVSEFGSIDKTYCSAWPMRPLQ